MNRFVIITACYNVENWIGKSILSVKKQSFSNFKQVIVDDFSTDKTAEIIQTLIKDDDRFSLIKNEQKKCSLQNIYEAIHDHTTDEDIVVILDGDDFFASKDTLRKLDEAYNKNKCWLTYGSYMNLSDKNKGKFSKQLPQHVITSRSYRQHPWCTSHLRSFKSFLFKSIKQKDLKDNNDQYYNMAGDLAIMFPMLEMSANNSLYIEDILYIWNDINTLNEHKVNNNRQVNIENIIRSKEKYDAIKR